MEKLTILIVDDEADLRRSIGESLKDEYNYLEAETGLEALAIMAHSKVDLILTDFNMPDLDGLELIKSLYEISSEVPVVVMTGRGSQDLHIDVLAHNVFEYVEKPFQFKDLRNTLRKCLLYYQDHQIHQKEPNLFSRSSYEDIQLKIPKKTAEMLRIHCQQHGLSMSAYIDQLVTQALLAKKAC